MTGYAKNFGGHDPPWLHQWSVVWKPKMFVSAFSFSEIHCHWRNAWKNCFSLFCHKPCGRDVWVDGVAAFRAAWYKAASKPITFYIAANIWIHFLVCGAIRVAFVLASVLITNKDSFDGTELICNRKISSGETGEELRNYKF